MPVVGGWHEKRGNCATECQGLAVSVRPATVEQQEANILHAWRAIYEAILVVSVAEYDAAMPNVPPASVGQAVHSTTGGAGVGSFTKDLTQEWMWST